MHLLPHPKIHRISSHIQTIAATPFTLCSTSALSRPSSAVEPPHNPSSLHFRPSHSVKTTTAISCYLTMLQNGIAANNYTFPPLIKSCTALISSSLSASTRIIARLLHSHVLQFGFAHDPYVVSAFTEFYSASRDLHKARVLFDETMKKDVVLRAAMIDGYGKIGDVESARELFDELPDRNVVSWSAMMVAYSRVNDFK